MSEKPSSFDESNLVDLLQCSHSTARFFESGLAQESHALFARDTLDLRGRTLVQNHLAYMFAQVEQLVDSGAATDSGASAFEATGSFIERHIPPFIRIQAALD